MSTLNFNPFPTLCTDRLLLRQLDEADDIDLLAIRQNPEINKYIIRAANPDMADIHQFLDRITLGIETNKLMYWAVCLKADAKLIGTICMWNFSETGIAEVGYELLPHFQRQGIIHEALGAVKDYAFNTLKLKMLEALVHPANTASVQLLLKNNFVLDTSRKAEEPDLVIYVLQLNT